MTSAWFVCLVCINELKHGFVFHLSWLSFDLYPTLACGQLDPASLGPRGGTHVGFSPSDIVIEGWGLGAKVAGGRQILYHVLPTDVSYPRAVLG